MHTISVWFTFDLLKKVLFNDVYLSSVVKNISILNHSDIFPFHIRMTCRTWCSSSQSVPVQPLVRAVPVNVPVTSATLSRVRRLMARVSVMPGGKGSTVPTTSQNAPMTPTSAGLTQSARNKTGPTSVHVIRDTKKIPVEIASVWNQPSIVD